MLTRLLVAGRSALAFACELGPGDAVTLLTQGDAIQVTVPATPDVLDRLAAGLRTGTLLVDRRGLGVDTNRLLAVLEAQVLHVATAPDTVAG